MSLEKAVGACFRQSEKDVFTYHLPSDFPAFAGHFEGRPLLPGVCQFLFCADAAGRLLNKAVQTGGIKRAKFIYPALPETDIAVRLTLRPDGWYLAELTCPQNGKKLSQLILQFSERQS